MNAFRNQTTDQGSTDGTGGWKRAAVQAGYWSLGILAALALIYFGVFFLLADSRGEVRGLSTKANNLLFGPAKKLKNAVTSAVSKSAPEILVEARKSARAENKRVMLIFCTESCLGCRHLDAFLEANREVLERHYVLAHVDLKETPDNEAVHSRYRDLADSPIYFPWIAVLNGDEEILFTSDGLPGSDNAVKAKRAIPQPFGVKSDRAKFIEMIRKTAPGVSEEELTELKRSGAAWAKHFNYRN
jgi:hypothetical protein